MKNNNFWRWIKEQIVQEVPVENAACEFDCRHENCCTDEWITCPNRARYIAVIQGNKEMAAERIKKPT